jgi:uncharacterized protein (TIGR02466 family)
MSSIESYFVTRIYRAQVATDEADPIVRELDDACRSIAVDDEAGRAWCRKNGYPGYTSYASLNDLPWRFPVFKMLAKRLDKHVALFAKDLELELGKRKLALDSLWTNVLDIGGVHTSHIHPHSVISGTVYIAMPPGTSAIRFEDPRHAMMMAAPPRKAKARPENRSFIYVQPEPGTVLLWESYLRHEVPANRGTDQRISVSFNYRWG